MLYWAQNNEALATGLPLWALAPGVAIAILGSGLALLNYAFDEIANPALRPVQGRAGWQGGARVSAILSVRDLASTTRRRRAGAARSSDVSLDLEPGEFLAIVGESGCGKTTLLFAIAQLLTYPASVTGGSILFDGVDMTRLSPEELRQHRWRDISVVMQSAMNALNPTLIDRRAAGRRLPGPHRLGRRQGRGALGRGARDGRHRPGAPEQLPLPALGRHAPARDDRHGPAARAQAGDHGRAHVGARRGGPALPDAPDRGPAPAPRASRSSSSPTT